jgi:triacylglycerol lipase
MSLLEKPIPLPEADKLLPPDLSRAYFESCAELPFEATASEFSLKNAWWLAEASFAAYGDDNKQVNLDHLTSANWKVSVITSSNVRCLTLDGPDALILAFRGTRVEGFQDPVSQFRLLKLNWSDLIADVNFPRQDLGNGRKAHRGFVTALDMVSEQMKSVVRKAKQLSPDKQIWCTGHSLGAALATVAADRLSQEFKVQGLYTYGSPRVGNDDFVNSFPVPNAYRFVHHRDVITMVPPPGLFAHVGRLRYLTTDGRLLEVEEKHGLFDDLREGVDFWKKVVEVATKAFHIGNMATWPVPVEALADHAPVYYANETWNLLVKATTP